MHYSKRSGAARPCERPHAGYKGYTLCSLPAVAASREFGDAGEGVGIVDREIR